MKNVLLIDDDPEIRDLIFFILKEEGYHVIFSGIESMEEDFIKAKPGLILFDGWKQLDKEFELISRLKKGRTRALVPLILFSTAHNISALGRLYGADCVISKPFDIEELIRVVKTYYRQELELS